MPLVPLRGGRDGRARALRGQRVPRRAQHGAVRAGAAPRALPVLPAARAGRLPGPRQHLQGIVPTT